MTRLFLPLGIVFVQSSLLAGPVQDVLESGPKMDYPGPGFQGRPQFVAPLETSLEAPAEPGWTEPVSPAVDPWKASINLSEPAQAPGRPSLADADFAENTEAAPVSQGEDDLSRREALGKLKLGLAGAEVIALLGKPEKKGREVLWEAIGEWVQEWHYPAQGLQLNMASAKKGGSKSVLTITASGGCTLSTVRGISIGSSEAAVKKAYGSVQDKEQSEPGKTFVAGSVYGGVIFQFEKGKVSEIFIGAAAE